MASWNVKPSAKILLILMLLTGQEGASQTEGLFIPLVVNGSPAGEVEAFPFGAELRWSRSSVIQALGPLGNQEALRYLREWPQNQLALTELQRPPLKWEYDEAQGVLRLSFPPELYPIKSIKLSPPPVKGQGVQVEPADFALVLNGRLEGVLETNGTPAGVSSSTPVESQLYGWMNLFSWVLVSGGSFSTKNPARLLDLRLLKDWGEGDWRSTLGKITPGTPALIGAPTLWGLQFASQKKTADTTRPLEGQYKPEFFLDKPSLVELWVNGRVRSRFDLGVGTYAIEQLELQEGLNQVEIKASGATQKSTLYFLPFGFHLLPPGQSNWNGSLGLAEGAPWEDLTGSLYHLWGLHENFSLGWGGMLSTQKALGFLQGNAATAIGNFGWTGGLSWAPQASGPVGAFQGFYQFALPYEPQMPGFILRLQYVDGAFNPWIPRPVGDQSSWSGGFTWDQRISSGAGFSATVQSSYFPDTGRWAPGVQMNYRQNLGSGLSLVATAWAQDHNPWDYQVTVNLNYRPPFAGTTVTSTTTWLNPQTTVSWDWSPEKELQAPGFQGAVSLAAKPHPELQGLGVRASYRDYSWQGALSSNFQFLDNGWTARQALHLEMGLAGVSSKGQWGFALSRPLGQNFFMAVLGPGMETQDFGINPQKGQPQGFRSILGGAVLPDLVAGLRQGFILDLPHMDLQTPINQTSGDFVPGNYTGGLYVVQTLDLMDLTGRLHTSEGEPLVYQFARLERSSGQVWEFFTREDGRFFIPAVNPGDYKIVVELERLEEIPVAVPGGKTGVWDLGGLRLPKEKKP